MKKILLILIAISLSNFTIYAEDEDKHLVECSDGGGCVSLTGANGSEIVTEKSTYTSFDFGLQSKDVEITIPNNEKPKDLRMNISMGEYPGKNLSVNLSAQDEESDSGSVIILADNIKSLNLTLNGYNGVTGKDASVICAEKFKDGDFGANALAFFNNRRSGPNPDADPNRCDGVDLNYLEEFNFFCDNPNYEPLAGSNPTIEVARIRSKARCSAVLVRDECLRRKKNVTCRYRQWEDYCTGSKGGRSCGNRHTGRTQYFSKVHVHLWYDAEAPRLGNREFCLRHVSSSPYGYVRINIQSAPFTSPGVDAATGRPLPGSDWEQTYSQAYGTCPSYWEYVRTVFTNEVTFDENDTKCDDVGIAADPNNLLIWKYVGLAQEPDFGTQIIPCSPGDCPLQSSISELSHEIGTVAPQDGKNGTQRGKAIVLAYDIEEENLMSINGQAGAGGKNDLETRETVRYCVSKRDADTDGILSDYARTPVVNFRKYRWQPLRSQVGGNPGNPPNNPNTTIEIYTKVSDSVRFLMQDSLL